MSAFSTILVVFDDGSSVEHLGDSLKTLDGGVLQLRSVRFSAAGSELATAVLYAPGYWQAASASPATTADLVRFRDDPS